MSIIRTITLLSFLVLSGCAIPPPNYVDGKPMSANSGVLVVGLHTDWHGHDDPMLANLELLYKSTDKDSSIFDYKELYFQGDNYITIIELPASEYHIYRQMFSNRYWNFSDNSKFTIKPNTISYIGDITSNISISGFSASSKLMLEDKYDEIKKYLHTNYPKLSSMYKVEKQLIPISFE